MNSFKSPYNRPAYPAPRNGFDAFDKVQNNAKTAATTFAVALLLLAVIFTGIGIFLAVTFSPWWYIGVAICGGYALLTSVWLFVVRKMFKAVSNF